MPMPSVCASVSFMSKKGMCIVGNVVKAVSKSMLALFQYQDKQPEHTETSEFRCGI